MPVTLGSILAATRERVAQARARAPDLLAAARDAAPTVPWLSAFRRADVGLIGEVKRRSPSFGPIAPGLSPAAHARAYVAGGAVAISVLTEEAHFGGSLTDLADVRKAVSVPLLRKDFIIDQTQLYEARIAGASAVLLIVRALESAQLEDLAATARELGLARLVEVHAGSELARALSVAPEAVGVNARDLDTFEVNLSGAERVLRAVPPGVLAVAESGLSQRSDVERVAGWGADAVLVGTAIARARDPERAVRRLVGVRRSGRGAPDGPSGSRDPAGPAGTTAAGR